MPITQRWVHGGLVLTVAILSICLSVLFAGAARKTDTGIALPGARAASFYLRDTTGRTAELDVDQPVTVLVFADHESRGWTHYLPSVNGLISTYTEDPSVSFLGLSYTTSPSLLGPNGMGGR